MWFRSLDLSHVIWDQTSKDLSSLWQLIIIKPRNLEFSNFQCNCVALWQGFLTGGKQFIPFTYRGGTFSELKTKENLNFR